MKIMGERNNHMENRTHVHVAPMSRDFSTRPLSFVLTRAWRQDQWRILRNDGRGEMLCGLVTKLDKMHAGASDRYRIELFMKIEHVESTEDKAMAFVRGVFAACDAFNVYKKTHTTEKATS